MSKRDEQSGNQKGAQEHAEGQHGGKAHSRFLEEIHEGSGSQRGKDEEGDGPQLGRHPIHEDREQHDEADKNADKNRLQRDIDRMRLDRSDYQVPGGSGGEGGLGPDESPRHGKRGRH